jgi:hypothetical protein
MADDRASERELVAPTGVKCGQCGEALTLTEEIFELRVVQAELFRGALQHYDVLDDDGDFSYTPYFFEFMCWEQMEEGLRELAEDMPPIEEHGAILECDVCRSDILPLETLGLVRFGELHHSPKNPDGTAILFESMGSDKHLCISCLHHVNRNGVPYWNWVEPIPDRTCCSLGIQQRCWRKNQCTCSLAEP